MSSKIIKSDCLILESLHLCFDMEVSNTKNYLSKLLQSRLEMKYAGEVIYYHSYESVWEQRRMKQGGRDIFQPPQK